MAAVMPDHTKASGRAIAEIGIVIALSLLLALFSFSPLPFGGQISLEMLPLLVLAQRRGFKAGFYGGALFGFLHIMQEPVVFNLPQLLLDYPLAYGILALSGLQVFKSSPHLGIAAGIIGRLLMHVLSGVIFAEFFLNVQPDAGSVWLLSLSYNASFLALPSIIALIVVPIVSAGLKRRPSN